MAIEDLDSKAELMRFIREEVEAEPLSLNSIDGLQQATTAGAWQELALSEGWVNNSPGVVAKAAYRTLPGGGVEIRGFVHRSVSTPSGTPLAVLPKTLRPKEIMVFPAVGWNGGPFLPVELSLSPEGVLTWEYVETLATVLNVTLAIVYYP